MQKTIEHIKNELSESIKDANQNIEDVLQTLIESPIENYKEIAVVLVKLVVIRDSFVLALELVEEEA